MDNAPEKPAPEATAESPAEEQEFVPQRYASYELFAKIAEGGMAEVFLARKLGVQGFQKVVVVKRVIPRLARNRRFVQMFLDEGRIAAQLDHPNVVQVYDLGEADGTYFIAMEYLRGQTTRRLMRRMHELRAGAAPEFWCRIMEGVLNGLDFAHNARSHEGRELGVVHRDVTPGNIMVTYQGVAKVIDFGVARAEERVTKTKAGAIKGKFAYLAPEQCEGKPVDRRSDVFQAGACLWEMVAGRRLFRGKNELMIMKAILEGNVPPPSSRNKRVSPELDSLILTALEPDPGDRFQSAGAMRDALRSVLRASDRTIEQAEVAAFMEKAFVREREADQRLVVEANAAKISSDVIHVLADKSQSKSISRLPSASSSGASEPASATGSQVLSGASVAGGARKGLMAALFAAVILGALAAGVALILISGSDSGSISVTSDPPGASVEMDGEVVGTTPVVIPGVPVGENVEISITLAGYQEFEEKVRLREADQMLPLHAGLSPDVGTGVVLVVTEPPGARIEIDGVDAGRKTPVRLEDVDGGKHSVSVLLDGYAAVHKIVAVRPGETSELELKLVAVSAATAAPVTAATTGGGAPKITGPGPGDRPPESRHVAVDQRLSRPQAAGEHSTPGGPCPRRERSPCAWSTKGLA